MTGTGLDRSPTVENWRPFRNEINGKTLKENAVVDCGWGRLLFGHTFTSAQSLIEALRAETPGERDIAFYIRDPHVVLALAPQEVFLDPSHTYRLDLAAARRDETSPPVGFRLVRADSAALAEGMNRVWIACGMVPTPERFFERDGDDAVTGLAAVDEEGAVIGCVTGVDHVESFDDPEGGSSLWCLAVDPQAPSVGVGEALVRALAERYRVRGRSFLDLSVMHDNRSAIALYTKLGFERIPAFCVKRKNPINEPLFAQQPGGQDLNPYARILVDEALRRGIAVEVLDAEHGYFRLSYGGRSVTCRESLSELTTAVAMSRCDDKSVARRVLAQAGLKVPAQDVVRDDDGARAFLNRYGRVVVKPVRGEQGKGVSVDISEPAAMDEAIAKARRHADEVLIEEYVEGSDLRIVVIDHETVAGAVRRPAEVVGTGRHTVAELIEKQSRRRAAATGGESRIPLDTETERCVAAAGFAMDDVPPKGCTIRARRGANLHTGGTIHDVTGELHPALVEAAEEASRALDIPVVGLDVIVPDVGRPDYAIIEANERPGLANHEPQPTAERFIDLLFPNTALRTREDR